MTIAVTWDVSGLAPLFILPLSDSGAGAVNTAVMTSMGSGTPTFTRATAAWTKLSTGLWASIASGTARSSYLGADTTVGAYGGYLVEGVRTNNALWSRDLTNAAWAATNVTTAKTATGIDGVTNSATTFTASAGNGTVLQTITLGSQANVFQPFVKRRTGTGTINITVDGGTTWTPVTINATTYTQVQVTKTAANPSIGFQIVTNGDAIDVDMADMQNGAFASTPIPTTTIAIARNADVLTYPSAGNINGVTGAVYAEAVFFSVASVSTSEVIISTNPGGTNGAPMYYRAGSLAAYDGTAERLFTLAPTANVLSKVAVSWSGTSINGYLNGTAGTAQTFDGNMNLGTNIMIGEENGVAQLFGSIRNVQIFPVALSVAQLQAKTT